MWHELPGQRQDIREGSTPHRPQTMGFPWTWWEHSSRNTAEMPLWTAAGWTPVFPHGLPGSQSSDVMSGLRGSIPHGTPFERHWGHFPRATEIPSCSTRGLCLKDKSQQQQQQQAGPCALPQCSANFHCPNTGVQPLIYTTSFSCRSNLWSTNPYMLSFSPACVSEPSKLPLQIFLSLSLLPVEQENLSDCKTLRQKKVPKMSLLLQHTKELLF